MEFRNLKADEIDVRVGQVYDGKCTLLLYKDARADMDILDEVVHPEKWQRKHYEVKDNMYCSVGIKCGDEWVWKDDCGTESNTEKEKGEASDSFKRACVNWGIGRELYTAPQIYVDCKTDGKKVLNLTKFRVDLVNYDGKEIKQLIISAYDRDIKSYAQVFPKTKEPKNTQPTNEKPPLEVPKKKPSLIDDSLAEAVLKAALAKGYGEKIVSQISERDYGKNNIFELTKEQGEELLKKFEELKK